MMLDDYAASRFEEACGLLSLRLKNAAMALPVETKAVVEELRLRIDRPVFLVGPDGETELAETRVLKNDLDQVLDKATDFSRYASVETIRRGYVTAAGGFRIGICGTALPSGEENEGMRDVSSLAIRIPRVREGVAEAVLPEVVENGRLASVLILSPPGGGKTTLLRDLVRVVSQGGTLCRPCRVALVDERGELAAVHRGRPQLEVGCRTDVLDGCPKRLAVPMLLRAMSPQVIALDEIALEADVDAVCAAAGCGAALVATVHAGSVEDLQARPVGRKLLECGVFQRAVLIERVGGVRSCRVVRLS